MLMLAGWLAGQGAQLCQGRGATWLLGRSRQFTAPPACLPPPHHVTCNRQKGGRMCL